MALLDRLNTASTRTETILEAEEKHREELENAKPDLVLYLDGKPLSPTGPPAFKHPNRGDHTVAFQLRNKGTATATGLNILVRGGRGIGDVLCNNEGFRVYHEQQAENEEWATIVNIEVPKPLAKNGGTLNFWLSFKPIHDSPDIHSGLVHFEVQTRENPVWVGLATLTIQLAM